MRHFFSAHRSNVQHLIAATLLGTALLSPLAFAGTVQFSASSQQASESDGSATITIERTGDPANAAAVDIVFTHGTATQADFALATQSVSWAAGDSNPKTIDVTLVNDGSGEGTETAYFALTNVSGDTLGSTGELQLQILDGNGISAALPSPLRSIIQILDTICDPANAGQISGALVAGCSEYATLTREQQQIAATTMLPRQVAAQITNAAQSQYGANQAIRQRMQNVRSGGNGNSFAGLSLMMDGELVSAQSLIDEWAEQNLGGNAGEGLLDDRFGVFVSGQVQVSDKDSTDNELGYEGDSQQITAGMDYRASDKLFYGGALSYSTSNADYNDNGGKQDSDIVIINAFGNYYFNDNWHADALINYGASSFDNERVIRLGSNRYKATSDTDGSQWGFAVTGGYDKSVRAWQLGGYARGEYNNFDIDGYDEKGGGGFALAIDKHDAKSMQTAFGGSVSYVKSVSYGIWVPKLSAEWVHEFEDDTRDVSAHFVNAPLAGKIELPSSAIDSDFFNIGWSIAGTFAGGKSAYLRYEAQLGRDDYIAELVELGARIPF